MIFEQEFLHDSINSFLLSDPSFEKDCERHRSRLDEENVPGVLDK